jgi:hypothetical protein
MSRCVDLALEQHEIARDAQQRVRRDRNELRSFVALHDIADEGDLERCQMSIVFTCPMAVDALELAEHGAHALDGAEKSVLPYILDQVERRPLAQGMDGAIEIVHIDTKLPDVRDRLEPPLGGPLAAQEHPNRLGCLEAHAAINPIGARPQHLDRFVGAPLKGVELIADCIPPRTQVRRAQDDLAEGESARVELWKNFIHRGDARPSGKALEAVGDSSDLGRIRRPALAGERAGEKHLAALRLFLG